MHPTRNTLHADIRARSVLVLGSGLAHALDLERHAKQAHWNVRSPDFKALHELFDSIAEEAVEYGDLLAERAVALGGTADGRVSTIASRSSLKDYPIDAVDGRTHLAAVADALATFGGMAREAIDSTASAGDADTADVFTEISRGLDKFLWMVEAHLPSER